MTRLCFKVRVLDRIVSNTRADAAASAVAGAGAGELDRVGTHGVERSEFDIPGTPVFLLLWQCIQQFLIRCSFRTLTAWVGSPPILRRPSNRKHKHHVL